MFNLILQQFSIYQNIIPGHNLETNPMKDENWVSHFQANSRANDKILIIQ